MAEEKYSIFEQQAAFMVACGQSVDYPNGDQAALYLNLIAEETQETFEAWNAAVEAMEKEGYDPAKSITEVVDGLIDTIYVCCGMLHSLGIKGDLAWSEVHESNMTKIDPDTGEVKRREDGKILKSFMFRRPNLLRVVKESWGITDE